MDRLTDYNLVEDNVEPCHDKHQIISQILYGIIKALQGFHEHPRAETLRFVQYPENETKNNTNQCQKVIDALFDVKCPFAVTPAHFFELDYNALTPMVHWVLRQGLLLECEDNDRKKPYAGYFYKTFDSNEQALTEFNLRLHEDGTNGSQPTYDMFKKRVFGKKISGKRILGEYLLHRKINSDDSDDSDSDDDITLPLDEGMISHEILLPTIEEIFSRDTGIIENYRDWLAMAIEKFIIDDEIQILECRIDNEAQAYFLTRQEFYNVDAELQKANAIAEGDQFDRAMAPRLFKRIDELMLRLQIFKKGVHKDHNATHNMVMKLKPELDKKGKEIKDPVKYPLYLKYRDFSTRLGKIIEDLHSLVLRLSRQTAETLGTAEREHKIDSMTDPPDLENETYFVVIDEKILDCIVSLSSRMHCIVEGSKMVTRPHKKAELYHQMFVSYFNDVTRKLADLYWKADLMQHNRFEEKARVDSKKAEMRAKIREEVKNEQLLEIVFEATNTIQEVAHALDENMSDAQTIRHEMMKTVKNLTEQGGLKVPSSQSSS